MDMKYGQLRAHAAASYGYNRDVFYDGLNDGRAVDVEGKRKVLTAQIFIDLFKKFYHLFCMRILKTLAGVVKEIPADYRFDFDWMAKNCREKYDLGKYKPECLGKEIGKRPLTIVWGAKRRDKDGYYIQLFCVDKSRLSDTDKKLFSKVEDNWLKEI